MTPRPTRFVALLLTLALLLQACPPITPPPSDGAPASTPSGWVSTAHSVLDILGWAIPAARLIIAGFSSASPGTVTAVLNAADIVRDTTLPGFRRALEAYERAGGDRCLVRSASDALVLSLIAVADTSGAAGYGLAEPLHAALSAAGAISDALTPICVDGGYMAAQSADSRIHTALTARPGILRPFPEIAPSH